MTNADSPESIQTFINFRSELLKVLADIQVQLAALEAACRETKPVDEYRMRKLKDEAEKRHRVFHDRLARLLPPLHEGRE